MGSTALCVSLEIALLVVFMIVAASEAMAVYGTSEEPVDHPRYVDGRAAVEANDWPRTVKLLSEAAREQLSHADTHNLLGYAYRKLQEMSVSFKPYREALRLNPAHRGAHEYIGEAYLMVGNLEQAEYHAAQLRRLCAPAGCEELQDLQHAIGDYRASKR